MKAFPVVLLLSALALAGCGSSGGNAEPPAPPAPVAPPPPPPPPEPTFEERLADLAAFDPNPCRARTPGFEALGGWLANDGRELGLSRVWIGDNGDLSDSETHGAQVWGAFTACAARSTESQYAPSIPSEEGDFLLSVVLDEARADGRDLIVSKSNSPPYQEGPLPDSDPIWLDRLPYRNGVREDGQRILEIVAAGNDEGKRTGHLQTPAFQTFLSRAETALSIVIGGYIEDDAGERNPAPLSSICGEADPLCLFAPWSYRDNPPSGTSISTPQVAAALDTVWTVWPDMDILDLRNLAFDCAENMAAREGDTSTERSYSYSNGRSFTSTTNSTWGHGILSLTCLFTPNGGLQDPTTGDAIAGGIIGPIAGPITGATITGVDYTGRDFGYGFAYPTARENFALAAASNLSAVQAISGHYGLAYAPGAYQGRIAQIGRLSVDLTAAGNAIGVAAQWQVGNLTLRSGMATQPEGVGSLTGSRAFRAPATISAAITAAYGRTLPRGFSAHLQADHWRTLATQARSLWKGADLRESRLTAALVKRAGRHEFTLQGVWRSGLSGSLDVSGRNWALSPRSERGVWLTWRQDLPRSPLRVKSLLAQQGRLLQLNRHVHPEIPSGRPAPKRRRSTADVP